MSAMASEIAETCVAPDLLFSRTIPFLSGVKRWVHRLLVVGIGGLVLVTLLGLFARSFALAAMAVSFQHLWMVVGIGLALGWGGGENAGWSRRCAWVSRDFTRSMSYQSTKRRTARKKRRARANPSESSR